jgi:SMI1 / KNR4 family (SUKH-1)
VKQDSWKLLLARFSKNHPADEVAIRVAENESNSTFPDEYRDFLLFTNGGEGFVGSGSYAALWRAEEVCSFNKEYEVSKYAPGLLLFGTNGGGECFGFDYRSPDRVVVQVPAIGMSLRDILFIAPTFRRFLDVLGQQRL